MQAAAMSYEAAPWGVYWSADKRHGMFGTSLDVDLSLLPLPTAVTAHSSSPNFCYLADSGSVRVPGKQ
jgi:hypothetical protein